MILERVTNTLAYLRGVLTFYQKSRGGGVYIKVRDVYDTDREMNTGRCRGVVAIYCTKCVVTMLFTRIL